MFNFFRSIEATKINLTFLWNDNVMGIKTSVLNIDGTFSLENFDKTQDTHLLPQTNNSHVETLIVLAYCSPFRVTGVKSSTLGRCSGFV